MSKGPGIIQRKINALFAADPQGVFTTEDLCREVYGSLEITKKQRVAVLRAAKAVIGWSPGMECWRSPRQGRTCIFFFHDNVMSYAIARQRNDDWCETNTEAKQSLQTLQHKELMAPGGAWWLHVQMWIAERDNDTARLAELQHKLDKELGAMPAWIGKLTGK